MAFLDQFQIDSIKGKIAIIHLWSPWCKLSRNEGIKLKMIYDKFKNDNKIVFISIGNESNILTYKKAVAEDKLPWLNLIDLNGKNQVWKRLGLTDSFGSGGCLILDTNGKIIARGPSRKQLEKILQKKQSK